MRNGFFKTTRKAALAAGACLLLSGCYVSMGMPTAHVSVGIPLTPMVSVGVSQTLVASGGAAASVDFVFSDVEIRTINDYYRGGRHNPHGSHEALPPGIRRQIRRGQGLPPGLRGERLPRDLERQLRPLPEGYSRVRLGTDIVIMDEQHGRVVDILAGR